MTITTAARQPLFGEVRNGVVWLSAAGALVADVWMHLPIHFPSVRLDAFVVMPDHFHGILVLGEVDWWEGITGASRAPFVLTPPMRYPPFWEQMLAAEARARGVPERLLPTPAELVRVRSPHPEPNTQGTDTVTLPRETRSHIQNPTLGQIIAYFKYQTTKRYNLPQAQPGATLWHTNYYERRLATCDALSTARAYILTNPARAG